MIGFWELLIILIFSLALVWIIVSHIPRDDICHTDYKPSPLYARYAEDKAIGKLRLAAPPEKEGPEEHGGDCPPFYMTVVLAVNCGLVGYVPDDAPQQDEFGYFISINTPFINSGGR